MPNQFGINDIRDIDAQGSAVRYSRAVDSDEGFYGEFPETLDHA